MMPGHVPRPKPLTPDQRGEIAAYWREHPDLKAASVHAWAEMKFGRPFGLSTIEKLRHPPASASPPASDHLTAAEREKVRGLWKLNRDATGATIARQASDLLGRHVGVTTANAYRPAAGPTPPPPGEDRPPYRSPLADWIAEERRIRRRLKIGRKGRVTA